jgi:GAF domain-containing protein
MELAVDAAQSRHLPGFLERFAERATRMLNAKWGGVMVFRGRETDLYQAASGEKPLDAAHRGALVRSAHEERRQIEARLLDTDQALAGLSDNSSAAVIFVPITASDEESLGSLCLLRERGTLEINERHLLQALASHAALSIENFRRFSQLERSKRQWVEDIDAISDYIVVHDRSFRIVRTNRSLASHLGVPPVALVGEAMSSLRQIAETGTELPCPFCRDT